MWNWTLSEVKNIKFNVLLGLDSVIWHPWYLDVAHLHTHIQYPPNNTILLVQPLNKGMMMMFRWYWQFWISYGIFEVSKKDTLVSISESYKSYSVAGCIPIERNPVTCWIPQVHMAATRNFGIKHLMTSGYLPNSRTK